MLLRLAPCRSLVLLSLGSRLYSLKLLLLLNFCSLLCDACKQLDESEEELALLSPQLLCQFLQLFCLLLHFFSLLVFHELHLVYLLKDMGLALLFRLELADE